MYQFLKVLKKIPKRRFDVQLPNLSCELGGKQKILLIQDDGIIYSASPDCALLKKVDTKHYQVCATVGEQEYFCHKILQLELKEVRGFFAKHSFFVDFPTTGEQSLNSFQPPQFSVFDCN